MEKPTESVKMHSKSIKFSMNVTIPMVLHMGRGGGSRASVQEVGRERVDQQFKWVRTERSWTVGRRRPTQRSEGVSICTVNGPYGRGRSPCRVHPNHHTHAHTTGRLEGVSC
jgi:hypothetical protein